MTSVLRSSLAACRIWGPLMVLAVAWQVEAGPSWQTADFAKYWFQGKAEVNHYKLEQNRYGEMREGLRRFAHVELSKTEAHALFNGFERDESGTVDAQSLNLLRMNAESCSVFDAAARLASA